MADGSVSTATNIDGAAAVLAPPIDHHHLGRYTLGNRALEIEVLNLFADQAPLTFSDLAAAQTDKAWHIAAHTLKGSARAVGAFEVARVAEAAERAGLSEPARTTHLAVLEATISVARGYIEKLT